jgi:exoribonuclease R
MTELEKIFEVSQVESPPDIQGMLQTKNYHDFMILSDCGTIIHTFTGAVLANKCLPGDHVSWKNGQCQLELRYEHPLIVGTLELTNKSTYGLTRRGFPMYLFTPYDASYPHFIVGSSEKDTSSNRIILIRFDTWAKTTFPRGLLEKMLGYSGDYDAEYQALIWQACPFIYPSYPYEITHTDSTRICLEGDTFNIDPKGCKDIDDVFTFLKRDDGWLVTITISDVASYVDDGSAIDIMASLIGQTLYNEEGTILRPMLPPMYQDICSLAPGKSSYGISMQFLYTMNTITNIKWFESIIENNRSYTYEEYQQNPSFPLQEIASFLADRDVTDSHKWVEQMMIFYNKEAAIQLKHAKMGVLRTHSEPNRQKLEEYKEYLPDFTYFAYSSAEYCLAEETDTHHYGLETDTYTHATSPIRRYADLINQRVLKNLIQGKDGTMSYIVDGAMYSNKQYIVPITMYDMNRREKAIKHFARDADFLKAIVSHTVFSGIIMDKEILENKMKIRIYVPLWKRMVSTEYVMIDENTVLSRDEQVEIDVTLYRNVQIKCAVMIQARNWKERIVIHIE